VIKALTATAAALFLTACATPSQKMTAERLIDANTKARGGPAAIESVRALDLQLEITEPKFTITGHYVATRDGLMRIDIYAGGTRVYTEALGPGGAWQMGKDATQGSPETGAGAASLKRGLIGNLYGLHELAGLGYSLTFKGSATRDGKDYWVLEKTTPAGFSETLLLDTETYLVSREIDTSALHPDVDPTEKRFETLRLDYQPTAGVLFARRSEKRDLDSGELVQTAVVKSVIVNPAVDKAIFARPE
jgi:hypothetical protein